MYLIFISEALTLTIDTSVWYFPEPWISLGVQMEWGGKEPGRFQFIPDKSILEEEIGMEESGQNALPYGLYFVEIQESQ